MLTLFVACGGQVNRAPNSVGPDGGPVDAANIDVADFSACPSGESGGSLCWARSTSAHATPSDVANFPDGSSLIIGTFEGGVVFGQAEVNATTLTSAGSADIYLAKYSTDGLLLWARRDGGIAQDEGRAVAALAGGGILATGSIGGSATFGAGEPGETTLSTAKDSTFLAKYDRAGGLVWAKRAIDAWAGTPPPGFAVLPDGSAFIVDQFESTITLDPDNADAMPLIAGGRDTYIAFFSPNGSIEWARQVRCVRDGECEAWADAAAVAADWGVYVAGWYRGTPTFGPDEYGSVTLPKPAKNLDMFLARYAPDGHFDWVVHSAGTSAVDAGGVAVLSDGGVVVTGGFDARTTFGAGEITETTLDTASGDPYVAKYTSGGSLLWARSASSTRPSTGIDIAAHGEDMVVVGEFAGAMTFASGAFSLASAGGQDGFIARLRSDDGATLWAKSVDGPSDEQCIAVASNGAQLVVTGPFVERATLGRGESRETTLVGGPYSSPYPSTYLARLVP
jgi:hypothetical protein